MHWDWPVFEAMFFAAAAVAGGIYFFIGTDAIVSKNLDGIITGWNKGAERTFGYTAEEAVGKPITILIPLEQIKEERAILECIRRGESIPLYETVRLHKDGSLIVISITVFPLTNAEGKVVGATKIARKSFETLGPLGYVFHTR